MGDFGTQGVACDAWTMQSMLPHGCCTGTHSATMKADEIGYFIHWQLAADQLRPRTLCLLPPCPP